MMQDSKTYLLLEISFSNTHKYVTEARGYGSDENNDLKKTGLLECKH